jgi:hypothetical protein
MHVPINVKSPNNTSKWQMGFNSPFKGLNVQKSLPSAKDIILISGQEHLRLSLKVTARNIV